MEKYISIIIKLAKKAYKKKEVPVGAIIIYKNKIIAKAYNKKQYKNDVTGHAEIIAIKRAAKKLKDWRLNDCTLYVTLEPCEMCKKIIETSRIKEVNYLIKSNFDIKYNTKYQMLNYNNNDYELILKKFFQKIR